MNTIPVTAIIPTYNRPEYLRQAVCSVLSQTRRPDEVIVIDDGSTEDNEFVLAVFGSSIKLVKKKNEGKSVALNAALGLAAHDYIWIVDDDDLAAPNGLSALYSALEQDAAAGWAFGTCNRFFGEWRSTVTEPHPLFYSDVENALKIRILEDFFIWQGAMLVTKAAYKATGPFDTRLIRSQDYDMLLRISRRYRGTPVSDTIFHQRHHGGTRGTSLTALATTASVNNAWTSYNHVIFREIYKQYDLSEYVLGSDEARRMDPLTGLIQRGSIMARIGLWDEATADFEEALEAFQTTDAPAVTEQAAYAVRRMFEPGGRANFNSRDDAKSFLAIFKNYPKAVRTQFLDEMFHYVPYRLRNSDTHARNQAIMMMRELASPKRLMNYALRKRRSGDLYQIAPDIVTPG